MSLRVLARAAPRPCGVAMSARAYSSSSSNPGSSGSGPSSSGPSSSGPSSGRNSGGNSGRSSGRKWTYFLPVPLLPLAYYFYPTAPTLNPQRYTDHTVATTTRVSPRHVELAVALSPDEAARFADSDPRAVDREGREVEKGTVVVQHVMVKNPDIMIERPYTPVNDASAGEMRVVVKRVRGGEVGRHVHALRPGDKVGLRGPITTFTLDPSKYDTVVMISTGTAIAPFLQLLSKAPVSNTTFRLLHAEPSPPKSLPTSTSTRTTPPTSTTTSAPPPAADDWSAAYLPALEAKFGPRLHVTRTPPGAVRAADVQEALEGAGRVMVLVCLPTGLMRPLCGPLTPTLEQGPLSGVLKDMGLAREQVWKLE